MGWYFRRSINLGGGFRLNFSKSGIGMSMGTRGARMSFGPRGSYVNVGAGGIYYRKRIGGVPSRQAGSPRTNPGPITAGEPIESIPVDQLVESSLKEVLDGINSKFKTYRNNRKVWKYFFISYLVGWPLLVAIGVSFFNLGTAGNFNSEYLWFGLIVAIFLFLRFLISGHYTLSYHLDEKAQKKYQEWDGFFEGFKEYGLIEKIVSIEETIDTRNNAGASTVLETQPVTISRWNPPSVVLDIPVFSVRSGSFQVFNGNKYYHGTALFFLPDMVLILEGVGYGGVNYGTLKVRLGELKNYITRGRFSKNAEIVRHTYSFVNKDGSPDGRRKYNPTIPVIRVQRVILESETGFQLVLQFSDVQKAKEFVKKFNGGIIKEQEVEEDPDISDWNDPELFSLLGGCSDDELFTQAVFLILRAQKTDPSIIQKVLKVGYSRAAKLLEDIEEAGIIGKATGNRPRKLNVTTVDELKILLHRQQRSSFASKGKKSSLDPYMVLGVAKGASKEEISDAYRSKAQQYHPDKVAHMAPEFQALAEQKMQEINEAYSSLKE